MLHMYSMVQLSNILTQLMFCVISWRAWCPICHCCDSVVLCKCYANTAHLYSQLQCCRQLGNSCTAAGLVQVKPVFGCLLQLLVAMHCLLNLSP